MSESKSSLRAGLRRQRQDLSRAQQRQAAVALARLVSRQPFFLRARRLALYLANDGELDPLFLLELAAAAHKSTYLPVLDPLARRFLYFQRWQPNQPLSPNRYGIPEPRSRRGFHAPPWTLDIVFLPLVGFDDRGNRLGMGGGFYDRTFDPGRGAGRRPLLVGLAHDFQQVDALPADPWDVPLDIIATDRRILSFNALAGPRGSAAP